MSAHPRGAVASAGLPLPAHAHPGLADIQQARLLIQDRIELTPLIPSPALSQLSRHPVYLKLENRQTTGSFKLRGASHALARLDAPSLRRGVVTASTGNHGRALAHAARAQGVRAVVCMSRLVPQNKVREIGALGAEIHIAGHSQDDAMAEALRLHAEQGLVLVPPFDHPDVIAGQGTLGLEILAQLPEVGAVLLPLSGGGLFAGVALALKSLQPDVRVIGITMQAGCAMHASLQAGHPLQVAEVPTLADSLGGGIGLDNRHTFALVRALADATVLVDEAAIAEGIRHAHAQEHEMVEGAGAVGLAALLRQQIDTRGLRGPIVALLSGRNIDPRLHRQLVGEP